MSYGKKERRTAALKGWETRRKVLPDFGVNEQALPTATGGDTTELAPELPVTFLFEAGNMASWKEPVFDIDKDGYRLIHNCDPVIDTVEKRGTRIAKLNWTVVGKGARADAMAEIVAQAKNWTAMIKYLSWADIDGVRFFQIKTADARAGGEPWKVPDFWMGGRKKFKAGGTIQWDGRKLVEVFDTTGQVANEPKKLPPWQFIIHRPGGGSSPEGDAPIGVATYRIAFSWEEARKNTDAHMDLFSIPGMVFKGNSDQVRPTQLNVLQQDQANRLKLMRHNKTMTLGNKEMIELIEPKGKGFADMIEYSKYLEGLIDQMFLGNQLTSTVNDANRTGDTSVHLAEESETIFCGAMEIAEALNRHLMPWIVRKNPTLPELEEGEFEPFLWPEPPVEEDEEDDQSISVEDDELGDVEEGDDGEEGPPPEELVAPDATNEDEDEDKAMHPSRSVTLMAGDTDHAHTAEIDADGDGVSSTDESEAAGLHSHDIDGGVVAASGSNNHSHELGEPELDADTEDKDGHEEEEDKIDD